MASRDSESEHGRASRSSAKPAGIVPLGEKLRARWTAPLRLVEAYWSGLRNGHVVPARADIDPRGIESVLEYSFIAEQIAPGHVRLRIGGSHLCEIMGMEVRGMPLSAMLVPVSRERFKSLMHDVFEKPARCELSLVAEKRMGQPSMTARMLLLPLADDFGDVSRVLGCLVSDGAIGRTPRRFELADQVVCAQLAAQTEPAPKPMRQPAGLAESQRPFQPGPVPYLRVVSGGKED